MMPTDPTTSAKRRLQAATGCNWCGHEWGEADASRCPECGHSDLSTVGQTTTIRAGDHVEHGPTGETWVIGRADAEHVEPFGWPRSRALAADCRVVKAASDAEHAEAMASAKRAWG